MENPVQQSPLPLSQEKTIDRRRIALFPCEVSHRSAAPGQLGLIAMLLGRKIRFNPDTEEIIGDSTAMRMLGCAMRSPWHL
jgi:hypothetical protein